MKDRWIEITRNEVIVAIQAKTTNKSSKIRENLQNATNMNRGKCENTKFRTLEDEQEIQDLAICIER